MEDRLKTILYNAISLLIDETFEQYDDETEWFKMLQDVQKKSLSSMGFTLL